MALPKSSYTSTELVERMKDPLWIEKTIQLTSEKFKDAEQLLFETIFSQNHENDDDNINLDLLHEIDFKLMLQRILTFGMDNFVLLNSFHHNRVLLKAYLYRPTETIYSLAYFGPGAMGPPKGVHGGALAAVFDQFAGFNAFMRGWCMTAELKVIYKEMVPIDQILLLTSRITHTDGRKVYVTGQISDLPRILDPTSDSEFSERIKSLNSSQKPNSITNINTEVNKSMGNIIKPTTTQFSSSIISPHPTSSSIITSRYVLGVPKSKFEAMMLTIKNYPGSPPSRNTDPDLARKWAVPTVQDSQLESKL